jgi:hypothetical protein
MDVKSAFLNGPISKEVHWATTGLWRPLIS